jgi:hypothetical protein
MFLAGELFERPGAHAIGEGARSWRRAVLRRDGGEEAHKSESKVRSQIEEVKTKSQKSEVRLQK